MIHCAKYAAGHKQLGLGSAGALETNDSNIIPGLESRALNDGSRLGETSEVMEVFAIPQDPYGTPIRRFPACQFTIQDSRVESLFGG